MPLVNVQQYFNTKTVKLSDSFVVIIDGYESFRCASFTPPKIAEWNEEEYKYGNLSQKFMIPKMDVVQELQIELYENATQTNLRTKHSIQQQKAKGASIGNCFAADQDFGINGYNNFYGKYYLEKENKSNFDHKTLDILILNNRLSTVVYEYNFRNLRLCKAEPYELSYQDESLTKWNLSYVFEEMSKGVPNENKYKEFFKAKGKIK